MDTRVPLKFALVKAMDAGMGLEMPFGDGLNDAIWKSDRNLSGMGLKMPSGMSIRKASMLWTLFELGV